MTKVRVLPIEPDEDIEKRVSKSAAVKRRLTTRNRSVSKKKKNVLSDESDFEEEQEPKKKKKKTGRGEFLFYGTFRNKHYYYFLSVLH